MTDIFICYRRGDSAGHAGRLFDGIKERLGEAHVFMDVADLRPGQDFAFELERAVGRADCLLALIGPHWVDAVNASGQRRIDDPNDFVRREIVSGLAHCKTVIPVLVHGAQMPLAAQLPEPLQPLVRRQAFELRDQRWESDVGQLMQSLGLDSPGVPASHVPPSRTHAFPGWWWQFGVGLLALIGVAWMAAGAWWSGPALTPPVAKGAPDAAAPSQATDPPTTAIARAPLAAQPARQRQGFLVALPAVAEVRFRTNRAQVVVSILGIRQELRAYSSPSWTPFQADRGRHFSVIVDGVSV